MTERYAELFVFYKRGQPVHIHSDRAVFETWLTEAPWLHPPNECEIVRFVPEVAATHGAARAALEQGERT